MSNVFENKNLRELKKYVYVHITGPLVIQAQYCMSADFKVMNLMVVITFLFFFLLIFQSSI